MFKFCSLISRRFVFEHLHQWIHSLPQKNIQEIGDQFLLTNKPCESSPQQQYWMPCVMSLSTLCQSALVKLRSSYGSNTQESSLFPNFPSLQSEMNYCDNISHKSREFEHLVTRYRKWLQMRFGQTSWRCRQLARRSQDARTQMNFLLWRENTTARAGQKLWYKDIFGAKTIIRASAILCRK